MLLPILAFLAGSPRQRSQKTSRHLSSVVIGRNRTVSFPSTPNIRLLASTDAWYFVHFYNPPDLATLRAAGIDLETRGFITSHLYSLYLSPSNASFLIKSDLAEVTEVHQKLIQGGLSVKDADYLIVETADVFDPKAFPTLRFTRLTASCYIVTSDRLPDAVTFLSSSATVYAITAAKQIEPLNRFASGYSQMNTKVPDEDFSFPRYLESKGIDESGVVVTILESRIWIRIWIAIPLFSLTPISRLKMASIRPIIGRLCTMTGRLTWRCSTRSTARTSRGRLLAFP
jgi:hypothetical protein